MSPSFIAIVVPIEVEEVFVAFDIVELVALLVPMSIPGIFIFKYYCINKRNEEY